MDEINQLTDVELREELALHMGSSNVPPVTDTTRQLMRRKLYRLQSGQEFLSVCSNDPVEGESDDGDHGQSKRLATSPGFHDSSLGSPVAAVASAAAASSSPSSGRRFDSTPIHPGAAAAAAANTPAGGSVFRETYRRRPLHDQDLDSGISGSGGYYGNPASPNVARQQQAGPAAAPSRFRPSLVTCGLVLALLGVAVFLLLHFDPLYENPVPEITH